MKEKEILKEIIEWLNNDTSYYPQEPIMLKATKMELYVRKK